MAYISLLSWGNSLRSWIRWWMLSWSPTCMLWQWLPLSPTWTMLIKAYQILFKIQVEGKIEINYVQLLFRCNSFFSWKLMQADRNFEVVEWIPCIIMINKGDSKFSKNPVCLYVVTMVQVTWKIIQLYLKSNSILPICQFSKVRPFLESME